VGKTTQNKEFLEIMSIAFVTNTSQEGTKAPSIPLQHQDIVRFHGDPALSAISNLMIKTIHGTTDLRHAQVICIGDYHSDTAQRHIRAQIINDLLMHQVGYTKIHFLIEGVSGIPQEKELVDRLAQVYERLIGRGLIHHPHTVSGWDDDTLIDIQYGILTKIQQVIQQHKDCQERIIDIRQRLSQRSKTDLLLKEFATENLHDAQLLEMLDQAINASEAVAKARDRFLFESIRKIAQQAPDSRIFVLAGSNHFSHTAQAIEDLRYCVLEPRENPLQLKGFHLFDSLYGHGTTPVDR
jgi:uncharacterized protein (DUF2384 family)